MTYTYIAKIVNYINFICFGSIARGQYKYGDFPSIGFLPPPPPIRFVPLSPSLAAALGH